MTEVEISVRRVNFDEADFASWPFKKEANAALKALRERGLNVEDCVRIHHAVGVLGFRFWVVARPDPLSEFTWLMRADGSWVRGRLHDRWEGPAAWVHVPPAGGQPIPATFTHVTRTVPHAGARTERYKTKSNGSCGRYVWSDDSVAICTCGWKSYEDTRPEARAAARVHLAEILSRLDVPTGDESR